MVEPGEFLRAGCTCLELMSMIIRYYEKRLPDVPVLTEGG